MEGRTEMGAGLWTVDAVVTQYKSEPLEYQMTLI